MINRNRKGQGGMSYGKIKSDKVLRSLMVKGGVQAIVLFQGSEKI